MLVFREFNSYDSRINKKRVVIPRNILVFGWNLSYLNITKMKEVKRIDDNRAIIPINVWLKLLQFFSGIAIPKINTTNQKPKLLRTLKIKPYLRGNVSQFLPSSNINAVIRTVLNFFFFYDKISQAQKSTNPLTANKNKKIRIKNI